jgi:hypothetical protein
MSRSRRQRLREAIGERQKWLLDPSELSSTIERLRADELLSDAEATELRETLPLTISRSAYILRHLAAHLAIGVVFAFDVIPLPIGTVARVTWVVGNRIYEAVLGNRERARVHSLAVMAIAAIPWLGYAAYLLPLRRASDEAAYLYANHLSYSSRGCSVSELVSSRSKLVQRLTTWLVPHPKP